MMRLKLCLFIVALLRPIYCSAQQSYVGQFDVYNGFTYFDSPDIHLTERGYHLQLGYNPKTWLATGFDYSVVTGTLTLTPNLLKASLAGAIAGQVAGLVQA